MSGQNNGSYGADTNTTPANGNPPQSKTSQPAPPPQPQTEEQQ